MENKEPLLPLPVLVAVIAAAIWWVILNPAPQEEERQPTLLECATQVWQREGMDISPADYLREVAIPRDVVNKVEAECHASAISGSRR